MHMTGSPCYDWQEEFDTCFLFGMRSERKSKDTPVPTHVQYDEVGVSPVCWELILNLSLCMIASRISIINIQGCLK
eukprot:UN24653